MDNIEHFLRLSIENNKDAAVNFFQKLSVPERFELLLYEQHLAEILLTGIYRISDPYQNRIQQIFAQIRKEQSP